MMRLRSLAIALGLLLLPSVAWAKITLYGPDGPIEANDYAQITVSGVANEALRGALLKHSPRERTNLIAAWTWAGDPLILFRSKVPGKFLLWVAVQREMEVDYVEIIIDVRGSIPDPDPDPEPADLAEYVQKLTKDVQSHLHGEIVEVFQGLVTRIDKGDLRGSSQILAETSAKLFGERRTEHREWIAWWNVLAQHLLNRKLVTNDQWAEAYRVVTGVLKGADK
jgi:hypothetical protein